MRDFTATAKLALASALLLGAMTTVGHAYSAEQQRLCTGDAMRLCSSEIPSIDRITACMVQKRASLSAGCKSVFQMPAGRRSTMAASTEE
jgi:hypothetical protein